MRLNMRTVGRLSGPALVVLASVTIGALAAGRALTPDDWLLSAESDEKRFELLQQQLRGMDQPMWEVGMRFRHVHEVLARGNYDLALYHWDKIGLTIRNGLVKRPARAKSAETLFLGDPFEDVRAGFSTREPAAAWDAFDYARDLCRSCHQAEHVEYISDQPLFDLVRPAIPRKADE